MKLLFADDEKSLQKLMSLELQQMGHQATICPDGLTAVAALEKNSYDCIIVDLDMPGFNGIEVMTRAKELSPETEVVVLTGKSSLDSAIAALRQGAFDYLTKPCKLVDIENLLNRVIDKLELTNKYRAARRQLEQVQGVPKLLGDTQQMKQVQKLVARVAPTNSTVLILGETGTGKELVARSVHQQSMRAEMPFVTINCGALPENLIESELFGHCKGSFTGAEDHRIGLFEVADGGTLFLDEIGELPKSMQAKLLRVLESGEIRRVGENQSRITDVRIVCATHRNLEEMVHDGEFREDLMFRINTFEVQLPALRSRIEDIPLLARHLLERFCDNLKPNDVAFTNAALESLQHHSWPGNVRELANVIEHATILCDDGPIDEVHLPRNYTNRKLRSTVGQLTGPISLRDLELQAINEALDRNGGNKPKAAEELGVSLKTLYNKLNMNLGKSA